MKIKDGDIVMLKSGGPLMVVDSVHNDGFELHCVWFSGYEKMEGYFKENSLKIKKTNEID